MESEELDILYVLERYGWSSCFLYHGGDELTYMGPTHIFNDPISELLNGLILMLKGEKDVIFSWYDEPGEYEWSIQRFEKEHHRINILITEYSEMTKSPERRTIKETQFNTKLKEFWMCG